jgi:hypothetical protein
MHSLASLKRTSQKVILLQTPARCFAGGGKKIHKIPDSQRDFDIVLVGGIHATALTKFWQNDHIHE